MSQSQNLAPNLLTLVDELENNIKETASLWIQLPTVKIVFKSHKISLVKFRDKYAIPIIEYFIAVVR